MTNGNRTSILQLLRQRRSLSRAELARLLRFSEGTVSRNTASLLKAGLIVEEGAENSTGGRPGIRLRLDDEKHYSVGVEIREWETRIGVGTLAGRVIETVCLRTPASPSRALDQIARCVRGILRKRGANQCHGAGLSVRGLVDSAAGVVELGAVGWTGVPVGRELERRLGVAVFVENDVRAAALAEFHQGSAEVRGSRSMLFVKVGEGVGFGVILDGRLYRGPRMAAGEFGQMVIADRGGPERTDRPGCLERLVANPATCERYRQLAGHRRRVGGGDSTALLKRICHSAMDAEPAAMEAITQTSRYLGIGIFNAVWALDVEVVIVDGAITDAWPLVAEVVRDQFPTGKEFRNFNSLLLRPSSLGGEATLAGAAALPFANLFSREDIHEIAYYRPAPVPLFGGVRTGR